MNCKYKYFIPIIGFMLLAVDAFRGATDIVDTTLDEFYGEYLGFALVGYVVVVQMPLCIGTLLLINDLLDKL